MMMALILMVMVPVMQVILMMIMRVPWMMMTQLSVMPMYAPMMMVTHVMIVPPVHIIQKMKVVELNRQIRWMIQIVMVSVMQVMLRLMVSFP